MKPNPVGWFEIYVDDLTRAQKFYEAVFNFKMTSLLSETASLKMLGFPMDRTSTGAGGAICKMEGFKAGANSTIVYFKSDDCAVEEKRVAGAGGRVFKPKTPIGDYGFISLVLDSEGNMIGLHSKT